jgi:hypothetical protein
MDDTNSKFDVDLPTTMAATGVMSGAMVVASALQKF